MTDDSQAQALIHALQVTEVLVTQIHKDLHCYVSLIYRVPCDCPHPPPPINKINSVPMKNCPFFKYKIVFIRLHVFQHIFQKSRGGQCVGVGGASWVWVKWGSHPPNAVYVPYFQLLAPPHVYQVLVFLLWAFQNFLEICFSKPNIHNLV